MKLTSIASLSAVTASLVTMGCSGPSAEQTGASQQAVTGSRAPTLLLSSSVLARLQARAAAADPAWTSLKSHCDVLATGTANLPTGAAYPDLPGVGQGYEGDGYIPEVMALGLCYQTLLPTNASTAAGYAAAGDRILVAMSTPAASGGQNPSTDDGYGIRNYGVGMAFGFDWLYSGLQASTRTQVITALDSWIDWYDTNGFSNAAPIANYFAGYVLAKAATGIATDPDNASAAGYWSNVQSTMFPQLLQGVYGPSMAGGGWAEGWEYGPLAVENYSLLFWSVETGKGLNWFDELPSVASESQYLSYFAWPSLAHMDDQGTIHSGVSMAPSAMLASATSAMLAYHGSALAPAAKSYANAVLAAGHNDLLPWQSFLYVDSAQPVGDYTTQPLSYFAAGPNHVAVRSSWDKTAVWGSFVPGTYIDSTESGEQLYNAGAVSIVAGDSPIIANASGQLPQVDGNDGETLVYNDAYGGTRQLYNTFGATGIKQFANGPSSATTHAQGFEDNGTFVHARGVKLEQMYEPSGVVSQWTRDFAYVRPGVFVVYDRTTTNASDNWVSWHTEVAPTSVATTDSTQHRFDVTGGSVRTLLPTSATVATVPVGGGITRLEVHSANASESFLSVVTVGATPDEVRISNADGNVHSGSLAGALVLTPRNAVVLFNSDHAAAQTTSSATYTVAQTATADHVLFDMAPSSSGYAVTGTVTSAGITVDIVQGGPFQLTAQNTLTFVVNTNGSVQAAPSGGTVTAPTAPTAPVASEDAGAPSTGSTDSGSTSSTPPASSDDAGAPPSSGGSEDAGTPSSGESDSGAGESDAGAPSSEDAGHHHHCVFDGEPSWLCRRPAL